ncbi:T9SS type A sorting domain-containing protein [Flavobacterium sp. AS60]|uniref:T9SS type A sorting domain-containing protein n=1 Tax=Flavobacterium anseongense TaxID=2910677 RepID=UPI001F19FDCA|nr:T9SS type A sorting domain-containing protein [Flavobacterium sp. AS60]MCF6130620.1 T9SS type A sorting domain-containing protein [Flavobacterium sp. AS60]
MKTTITHSKTFTARSTIIFKWLLFLVFFFGTQISFSQKTWDGGAGSSNWGDGNNWNPNGLPASTDAVTIGNGFNVIQNVDVTVASLTIGGGTSGSLQVGSANPNRSLTVTGNVNINSGATLNTTGNGGNTLTIGGNLTNNGTLNSGASLMDTTFNGAAQTISGLGSFIFNDFVFSTAGTKTINSGITVNGNWTNNGGTVGGTGTVSLSGGSQTIGGTSATMAFPNLSLSGGTKTFSKAAVISGNLSIASGAVANLGTLTTNTAATLTLGGLGTTNAKFGSLSSAPPTPFYRNNTYFTAGTSGYITVGTSTCIAPTVTFSAISNICAGSLSYIIPYTAVTGAPNLYSISGTGITSVTNGTLNAPSSSITVGLSSAAIAGTISPSAFTVSSSVTGCVSANLSGSVSVDARPTGVISGGANYCNGQNTTTSLNIAVTGTGPWSGTLSNGASFSGSSSPISVLVSPSGTTTYTIATLTDANCTANAGDKTGSATVTVNPLPIVTAANVSGCPNTNIALIGSPIGGTFSIANPYNGAVDTTYTYTYTDGNGCTNTSSSATVTMTTEINFNNIDDDCDGSLYNGHAPVVVDVTTPSGALATMNATIHCSTATNTTPYSGAQLTYKLKVTKTNAPTSVTYISSNTTSFNFSSASNAAHSSTYDVQATAIVNAEEQPYNGNMVSFTTPAAPTLPNPPTQTGPIGSTCEYALARIDSYIYANNSITYRANRYEFLVERMDNGNPVQTVSVATTVPYFKLTNIVGIPATMQVTYGTTYRIQVRYGYGATSFGSQIYTAYGEPCLVSTPTLPVSSIACGTHLTSVNSYVYVSGHSGGANQFEYLVTRVSPADPLRELPVTVVSETLTRNVANFKLTMLTSLFVGLEKEYSVSVRYRVTSYGMDHYSAWSEACPLYTPDFPETQIVEEQCGVEGVPSSINEYVYADAVAGATQYQFRLFNAVDAPYTEENPYDYTVYSPGKYVKLNQFPGLLAGVNYSVTVVAQLYGEYPNILDAKDCDIIAPQSTPEGPVKTVVKDTFQATAYPNPFAGNFMIDIKTSSQSVISLKVYDMIGRLIEQREVILSDVETSAIGDQYPRGVYNVVVAQDNELQTMRVIKR